MILKDIMRGLNQGRQPDDQLHPWQVFDLIGGTSTGGVIAIMLGRLRMSIDDCEAVYLQLSEKIFIPKRPSINIFGRVKDVWKASGRLNNEALELVIKETITRGNLDPDALLKDPTSPCKVFVCAILNSNTRACLLRSYENARMPELLYNSCKIWEACRATSAATRFFDPITIGPYKQQFVDGALKNNNPVQMVYREANLLWPSRVEDAVFISIGTGRAPPPVLEGNVIDVVQALTHIALETESTADDFFADHGFMTDQGLLYRFNVFHGLADIGLDEYKENRRIADATHAYMSKEETRQQRKRCLAKLWEGGYKDFLSAVPYGQPPEDLSQTSLSELSDIQRAQCLDRGAQNSLTMREDSQSQAYEAPNEVASGFPASVQTFTKIMYAAIADGDFMKFNWAIEEGADVNAEMGRPLREATSCGDTEMIKLLIRKGAAINSTDMNGKTALHIATAQGNEVAVKVLLELGIDADALDNGRCAALHYVTDLDHGSASVAKLLLDSGANIEARAEEEDGTMWRPLQLAASKGRQQLVRALLVGGAAVNISDNPGLPALHLAVINGHMLAVEVLLGFGADTELRSGALVSRNGSHATFLEDWTALHYAAHRGDEPTVRLLLDKGAAINVKTGARHHHPYYRSATVLHLAASCFWVSQPRANHVATVSLLIERGADVIAKDFEGYTALERAEQKKGYKIEPRSSIAAALIPLLRAKWYERYKK
ncbi:Ankyrin-2 [Trapelia coarctata]|nr:Ankyrin-2 [Trapelia coarctata]